MATTTNYSWSTPDDTALVKDGASAIRSLGTAIDSTVFTNAGAAINKTIIDAAGDLIYGTAADTAARLALGTAGQILTVNTGATAPEWKSPSTLTFTHRTNLTASVNGIEYNGTDLYVAYGDSGKLSTSPDGITWTARTSGFGANAINSVFFGNSLWVAVGANGTITTSSDGVTWTARTSNMSTNAINHVTYANSIWVAVGAGGGATNTGGITYSTDGTTWTRKSQVMNDLGTTYYASIYNGTNWIVVGATITYNYLRASAPSGTWTSGADGSGASLRSIYWDGTRALVITDTNFIRFSTSTTLGTTTLLSGATVPSSRDELYYYNGNLYYIGTYVISYSTTPMSGNYAKQNYGFLSPTTSNGTTGAGSNTAGAIWVGSAGYICGGTSAGNVFTSF
jgi:hypothetical protein